MCVGQTTKQTARQRAGETLFVLSQENLRLAAAEVEALTQERGERRGRFLLLPAAPPSGLALARSAHEVLFTTTRAALAERIEEFDWPRGRFAVRAHGLPVQELADGVWRALARTGTPRVDLTSPENEFVFFQDGELVFATRTRWRNTERFADRRAHLRPRNHPTSLHPKLARAMINLAGPARTILDPFCGAGGLLIEGALAGRRMAGVDIDARQIARARENLAHYGCAATLSTGDATMIAGAYDAIVTDLPLGRNARLSNRQATYERFFQRAAAVAPVLVVASDEALTQYCAPWRVQASFSWFLQRNYTKLISVLRR